MSGRKIIEGLKEAVAYAQRDNDPDWELLERNVIERLHAIRDAWPAIKGTPLEEQLGVPVLRMLAEFCACVELGEIEG